MRSYLGIVLLIQFLAGHGEGLQLSEAESKNVLAAIYYFKSMSRAVEDMMLVSFKERPQILNMFLDMKDEVTDVIIDEEVSNILIPRLLWILSRFLKKMDDESLDNTLATVVQLYTSFGIPKETLKLLVEGSQALRLSDQESKNILTAIYYVRSFARAIEDLILIAFKERPQILSMFVDMKDDMADVIIDTEVNTILIPKLLWMLSRFYKDMDRTRLEETISNVLKLYTNFGISTDTLKRIAVPLHSILRHSFEGKIPQDEMKNLIEFFDKVVRSV